MGGDFERFPGLQASGTQDTKQTEPWNQRTPNEWMDGKKGRKGEGKRRKDGQAREIRTTSPNETQ